MKILVPLTRKEYIDSYIDVGADEFYMGFYDENWNDRFGKYSDINRMSGFGRIANPYSFAKLVEVIKEVKSKGKKTFVTLNANGYSKEQIEYMESKYFPVLLETGIDGVILSDMNAIISAVKFGLKPVASTMCAIYNSDIAQAYKNIGVERMILPRDLSLEELEKICNKISGIRFEAFFMRNGCIFSDSYCLGMHRPECGATCTYTRFREHEYSHNYKKFDDFHDVDLNDFLYRNVFHIDACAMCALYKLKKIGIGSLKIVGRADEYERILSDIRITKENIKIAEYCKTEAEYLEKMRFPADYPKRCRMGMFCYYPEVRFN